MHLFVVFLVLLAVATPGQMKTVEELEKELEVLKIKFEHVMESMENIETKTEMMGKGQNDTEERIQYLEEMAKLNTIRNCQEMAQYGIVQSNFYHIDPDGPLVGHEPIRVWCEFSEDGHAYTEILHNSENKIDVTKCEEPGCYTHPIIYSAPQQQIEALKSLSEECEQSVRYDCVMTPLIVNNINFGFWNDPSDNSHVYWTGAHQGEHVCACFYEEDGCLEQNIKETTCNCDASVPEPAFDMGVIRNKTALPISSLHFGGIIYDLQQASHTLGRLRCWGTAGFEEGTSCSAIKRSGQFYNGLYNIKRNQEHSELVFCNLTGASGYEQGEESEIFIESSEAHFELVEKSIADINTDIGKLEDDVSRHDMKSSFCAFQDSWSKANSVINYDRILTEDSNVAGSSLETSTGLFTAGVGGTYRVDVSVGYMGSAGNDNQVWIRHNGDNINNAGYFFNRIYGTSTSYNPGGKSIILRLEKNDVVDVITGSDHDLHYITFCVELLAVTI